MKQIEKDDIEMKMLVMLLLIATTASAMINTPIPMQFNGCINNTATLNVTAALLIDDNEYTIEPCNSTQANLWNCPCTQLTLETQINTVNNYTLKANYTRMNQYNQPENIVLYWWWTPKNVTNTTQPENNTVDTPANNTDITGPIVSEDTTPNINWKNLRMFVITCFLTLVAVLLYLAWRIRKKEEK